MGINRPPLISMDWPAEVNFQGQLFAKLFNQNVFYITGLVIESVFCIWKLKSSPTSKVSFSYGLQYDVCLDHGGSWHYVIFLDHDNILVLFTSWRQSGVLSDQTNPPWFSILMMTT